MMRRRRAFSLLEVFITLGVISMLAGTVFAFMLDLLRGRQALIDASSDAAVAAALVERLEGELLVGVAGVGSEGGIVGDQSSIQIMARSVVLPTTPGATIGTDVVSSEIRFDPELARIQARRGGDGGMETVSDRVEDCRFRFFDGRRWVDSFDSAQAGSLPVAIEVAVWFGRVDVIDEDTPAGEVEFESQEAPPAALDDAQLPEREPDLLRVIIVPDGPVAAWREQP
jgi:type II secretory pathway pseudopilin PulG